jgi:hypothetical protein
MMLAFGWARNHAVALAALMALACVGCAPRGRGSVHDRLAGEWLTDGGLTRYVFDHGKYKMIEESGTSLLTYRVVDEDGDKAHLRVTLLRTGGGHDKYLHFVDDDQVIEAEAELNGIRIPSKWHRVGEGGGQPTR